MICRVVNTDNFGGDYPDEYWASGELSEEDAKVMANDLNKRSGPEASRYYKVVPVGYKLQPGFEP